jgi:hypothetical protein
VAPGWVVPLVGIACVVMIVLVVLGLERALKAHWRHQREAALIGHEYTNRRADASKAGRSELTVYSDGTKMSGGI